MALGKGSFGQMPIVQPPKMGSFGQYTQVCRSKSLLTFRPIFTFSGHFRGVFARNSAAERNPNDRE